MAAAIGLRHPASASCLGRHLRLAGRCPNNSSLFPPLAAVVVVALWPYSAEKLFYSFGIPERLRTLRYSIFTGGVGTNSLSQSLAALPAPSRREPLARPGTLHFRRKLCRHAKGPISEGAVAVGDWGSSAACLRGFASKQYFLQFMELAQVFSFCRLTASPGIRIL